MRVLFRGFDRRRRVVAAAAVLLLAAAAAASAQRRFGVVEGPGVPARYPPADFEDGAFTACKVQYTSVRAEMMGVGWATDYPYAAFNLMIRLSELSKTPVSFDAVNDPNYWVVRLTDEALFRCPFTIASDVGTMGLSDQEAAGLRAYLLKGGFLWVDDFWGTPAWNQWSAQIHKALPEYPILDVPPDHPMLHMLFQISQVPQITNIQNWRRTHNTSERGEDSPHANFRMIADDHGRVMVVMTHNTDIGDSWEREGEDRDFFERFSPPGYALGVNVLLYSMTH